MNKLISCEFNMDTAFVELKFTDGHMISIDTIAAENEVADNMYEQSEPGYLVYNDPAAYADLILNGYPDAYMKTVAEAKLLDSAEMRSRQCKNDYLHWRLFAMRRIIQSVALI